MLSALGLLASERRRDTARTVMLSGRSLTAERIAAEVDALRRASRAGRRAPGRGRYELRYRGQGFELAIEASPGPEPSELAELFATEHERRYGYRDPEAEVELVTIRVAVIGRAPSRSRGPPRAPSSSAKADQRGSPANGLDADVLRGEPPAGDAGRGPCMFELPESTLVLPPKWSAKVDEAGTIVAERGSERHAARPGLAPGTVGALRAVCDEMGAVLIRSAYSPNINERRDCSTAIFDAGGELVMQAEHIPVHLGSMPEAVAAVLGARAAPGRCVDPQRPLRGGTHLPDITLISPVFADGGTARSASPRAEPITPMSVGRRRAGCPPTRAARARGHGDLAGAGR